MLSTDLETGETGDRSHIRLPQNDPARLQVGVHSIIY